MTNTFVLAHLKTHFRFPWKLAFLFWTRTMWKQICLMTWNRADKAWKASPITLVFVCNLCWTPWIPEVWFLSHFMVGVCFMACIYFPKNSPHTFPLFPIREMELGIYSTTVEGVGISSIGASSPPSSSQKTFLHVKDPDTHAEQEEDQDWRSRITIHDFR